MIVSKSVGYLFVASTAMALCHCSFVLKVDAFSMSAPLCSARPRLPGTTLRASTSEETVAADLDTEEEIPVSRFVVQNRFKVRQGREAAFEKRWADRESRLGTLAGFRFFCMLRLIDNDAKKQDADEYNYVSCTVWENYRNFEAWRKGDAFKEAHGGGTVKGVVSMLAATARNTKGKPKPAYFGGLLPESVSGMRNPENEGWINVEADGVTTIPTDGFVAMNRFSVKEGCSTTFERRFADRESTLRGRAGFRGFLLLRRDGGTRPGDGEEPDDGCTHSTFSVWDSKAEFDAWMQESKEKKDNGGSSGKPKGGPPSMFRAPPKPSFYEGFLSLESTTGI